MPRHHLFPLKNPARTGQRRLIGQAFSMIATIGRKWDCNQFTAFGFPFVLFFCAPLMVYELWLERRRDLLAITRVTWPWRALFYFIIAVLLIFFPPPSKNEFIYFRF